MYTPYTLLLYSKTGHYRGIDYFLIFALKFFRRRRSSLKSMLNFLCSNEGMVFLVVWISFISGFRSLEKLIYNEIKTRINPKSIQKVLSSYI